MSVSFIVLVPGGPETVCAPKHMETNDSRFGRRTTTYNRGRLECVKPSPLPLSRLLDPFPHCIPAGQWPPPAFPAAGARSQLSFTMGTAMRSHIGWERWRASPNLSTISKRTGGSAVISQFDGNMDKLCLASRQTGDLPRKIKM